MFIEKMINLFIYGYGNGYICIFVCVYIYIIKFIFNIWYRFVYNLEILIFKNFI